MKSIFIFIIFLFSFNSHGLEPNWGDQAGYEIFIKPGNSIPFYKYEYKRIVSKRVKFDRKQSFIDVSTEPNGENTYLSYWVYDSRMGYISDINSFCDERKGQLEYVDLPIGRFLSCRVQRSENTVAWYSDEVPWGFLKERLDTPELFKEVTLIHYR